MLFRRAVGTCICLFLLSTAFLTSPVPEVLSASSGISRTTSFEIADGKLIWVPDNHTRIQWAINNASDGDTIRIRSGAYYENVVVNRTVSLIGENRNFTIVDGNGKETVFKVTVDNVSISGFTLQHGYSGVWLWHSENCTIKENNVKNNAYGIRLDYSTGSRITGNNVENNEWFGISLDDSGNSFLRNNRLAGKRYNFRVDGGDLADFSNDIDTSNTVNAKPIHYLQNRKNLTIDSSTFPEIGYLAVVNSTNVTVKNLNFSYNGQGILVAHTNNSVLSSLTASKNWNGIQIMSSSNITTIGNNANDNFDYGIKLASTRDSLILDNVANNNNWAGIGIFTSEDCTVKRNNMDNNYYGLHIVYSSALTIERNNAWSRVNGYSIVLYYSSSNLIFHNNFYNSFIYAQVKSTNQWDNGFEGNYWSGYVGDDADQDGIGDKPYMLEEGNRDNHPLMGKLSVFNIAPDHFVSTISNSTISSLNIDQQNKILHLIATGPNGTKGFSRIRFPVDLFNGSYSILVNSQEPATEKLITSNDTFNDLYVTYIHALAEDPPAEDPTQDGANSKIVIIIALVLSALALSITLLKIRRRDSEAEVEGPVDG